jgi:hypothetical protein
VTGQVHSTKPLATRPLPITLSAPNPERPVEPCERCAARFAKTEPEDTQVMRAFPFAPVPGRRPGQVGLTEEQRFLWDLEGVLHLRGVLSSSELKAARAAAAEYASFEGRPENLPVGFSVPDGGRGSFPHGFAFSEALASLAWHPKVTPAILELTDGKPKLMSGTLMIQGCEYGGGQLHCAREDHGWASAQHSVVGGRCHADNIVIFPYLDDVHVGDGGLVVLPGSHKSTLPRPGHKNDLPPLYSSSPADWSTQLPRGLVNVAPVSAGDFLILSEATVHGILPWAPRDRLRRFLVLRFGMQYSGSQPLLNLPPQCRERLSDTTRELMDYAHITHTKQIAMEYRIRNAGPRL